MKKFTILLATTFFLCNASYALAQSVTPSTRVQQIQARQDTRITDLQTRADNEITRRITALNALVSRLSTIRRLTEAQKSSFTTQIANQITSLSTLKTKIDAETDLTTLKSDVQSIITSYRIFALFMPQIDIMVAADRLLTVNEQMTNVATTLTTQIQTAKSQGNNTSKLETLLTTMQTSLTDASNQANTAITTVIVLTPSGYPSNQSSLQNARKALQTARQDLISANQNAKLILQGLRSFKHISTTP